MRVLALGITAAVLLAGCGQKGPLYLPDKTHTAVTPGGAQPQPQPAQPGTTTQKKNDKDDNSQSPQ
jgi:predicted small lipoprotein YifL